MRAPPQVPRRDGRAPPRESIARVAEPFAGPPDAADSALPPACLVSRRLRPCPTIQPGRIVIWDGTRFLTPPFLDLSSLISCCTERGLLSAAFHPQYATNGFFFVYYTNTGGNVTIARYAVSSGNPNLANP